MLSTEPGRSGSLHPVTTALHAVKLAVSTSLSSRACGRNKPVACRGLARPFQQGSGSCEVRPEVSSQAVAIATDAPPTKPPPLLRDPLPVTQQVDMLEDLISSLADVGAYEDKVALLSQHPEVVAYFQDASEGPALARSLQALDPKQIYTLLCLPAMGQGHILSCGLQGGTRRAELARRLAELAAELCLVEEFYDSLGGLLGYQRQCLQLIAEAQRAQCDPPSACSSSIGGGHGMPGGSPGGSPQFLVPPGLRLSDPGHRHPAAQATLDGLAAVPAMAEIYPLGGAGDRLGLCCEETGDSLPTALLQYCGRTLLETLVRDLQAREYLHWRLHGQQHTTPVAVMTSAAKGNHWRVKEAFESAGWFGRGRDAFRLFMQPMVPVVSGEDGRWLLSSPLQPIMKPGGHGVIWKLMRDRGVFDWLLGSGREAAIVRQISNPMAGQDNTLLALAGSGLSGGHAFGFASCERVVGAAEGINVMVREEVPPSANGAPAGYTYRVTNVEYTEFERLGFADEQVAEGSSLSKFPANTNVLFVGLKRAEQLVRDSMERGSTEGILPGMILNLKKRMLCRDPATWGERSVHAGRLECTMQNLADLLVSRSQERLEGGEAVAAAALDTFVVYNQRRKVTSSAKRQLQPGSTKVHQTPDGSFYDLQQNARDLLHRCGFAVPEVGSVPDYLSRGPGFMFLYHPALGPLWDVVAQKLRGGSLALGSELVLEVAELDAEGLHVKGSLLVCADRVMGHPEPPPSPIPCADQPSQLQQHHATSTSPPHASSSSSSNNIVSNSRGLKGGVMRKVHNGVEQSATLQGAFGGVAGSARAAHPAGGPVEAGGTASIPQQPAEGRTGMAGYGRESSILVYSDRGGRVRLRNVRVENEGVDWEHQDNVFWKHKVWRHQSARIMLRGCSEFEAHDVTLAGDVLFEVPDGFRMSVRPGPGGAPIQELRPLGAQPSWRWEYAAQPWQDGGAATGPAVQLQLVESGAGVAPAC